MRRKNILLMGIIFLSSIFLISFVSSAYRSVNVEYGDFGLGTSSDIFNLNEQMCQSGQDFVLQIAPFGCTPTVVRSDLLEEQNVPVFCQLGATQINPLINVDAIESISFTGDYPDSVSGVGFYPAKAALGVDGNLNSPVLNNIGYAVVVLKQQPNESAMPEYVSGNLTATLNYDVENAYGIGDSTFYLRQMTDNEWEDNYKQYSFWNGRGYLRLESLTENNAVISVYDKSLNRVSRFDLEVGETSQKIYLPNLNCLAGLKVQLSNFENPDTRIKLDINGEKLEVIKNEKFLNNRCYISNVKGNAGLTQTATLNCVQDEESITTALSLSPKVNIKYCTTDSDCNDREVNAGDFLYSYSESGQGLNHVYLAYVGAHNDNIWNKDSFFVYVFDSLVDYGEKLPVHKINSFASLISFNTRSPSSTSLSDFSNSLKGINYQSSRELGVGTLTFSGFSGATDFEVTEISETRTDFDYYSHSANQDYETIQTSFPNEKESVGGLQDVTFGERALLQMIKFSYDIYMRKTAVELAEKFVEKYPNSLLIDDVNSYLSNDYLNSNRESSSVDVFVNGEVKRITFEGTYQPSVEEYSVDIILRTNSGKVNNYVLLKDEIVYLDEDAVLSSLEKKSTEPSASSSTIDRTASSVVETLKSKGYGSCTAYIDSVMSASSQYGIDPLLLYSVMIIESDCVQSSLSTSNAAGLMQIIESTYNSNCKGIYGNSWRDIQGSSNTQNNIFCGAKILKDYYNTYKNGKQFSGACTDEYKSKTYTGWSAALRAYNGWGCNEKYPVQDQYVDKVAETYTKLSGSSDILDYNSVFTGQNEYLQLVSLTQDTATIRYNLLSGNPNSGAGVGYTSGTSEIKLDSLETFGSAYNILLSNVNLKKTARVSVIPTLDNQGTQVNFSFNIGIEKRDIQLSPEKIKSLIKNLDNMINDWNQTSQNLGNLVRGLKGACLSAGALLTIKNFIGNTDGEAIARKDVMRNDGGWYDICTQKVAKKEYRTLNECFTNEADNIDAAVKDRLEILQSKNDEFENLQNDITETNWLGEKYVDNDKLQQRLFTDEKKTELVNNLKTNYGDSIVIAGEKVLIEEVVNRINSDAFSITDLRDLEVEIESAGVDSLKDSAKTEITQTLTNLYVSTEAAERTKAIAESAGVDVGKISVLIGNESKALSYYGLVVSDIKSITLSGASANEPAAIIKGTSGNYYAVLQSIGNDKFAIKTLYNDKGQKIDSRELNVYFKRSEGYSNKFVEPKLRYYETEPYKGLPAIVPFDLDNGWYTYVKQTLPVGSNIKSYDESGRVSSFYLCNVGDNGREERTDVCQLINVASGSKVSGLTFSGLDESTTSKLISCAVDAIETASKQYKDGVTQVSIRTSCGTYTVKVGEPAVDVPEIQCQDIMSPKDCQILFNVCDPVVCPSSRCNLGGSYYVQDVIQSGIIGSTVLCLPNYREGIYIPVCLSGIKAGIDGFISVLEAYRDCLQDNLDEGTMVGICDEIYSIHLCEFFWRQTSAFAKILIPKIFEFLLDENVHGGGEYLSVKSAWENAEKSVDYFSSYYAANAALAFKAKITEDIGEAFCQSSISVAYPDGVDVLDSLTDPSSPPQFHGRFDEIPMTTATVPPISQYKVWYHIYAGEESRVYYQVYLKGSSGSSFYQDTSLNRYVDSGYVARGEYVDEAKDFTAPSGYTELCINVNGQEECGFEKTSTSFAVNYVEDKYLQDQAETTDIMSESECISGSVSLYGLINPNLQSALESQINPEIYKRGIVRVCATQSPGKGTDSYDGTENARWVDVGYCDDTKIRCWLDTDSLKDIIKNQNILNETIESITNDSLSVLLSEGNYITDFDSLLNEIEKLDDNAKIEKINDVYSRVFYSAQKARLLLIRGNAYANLAKNSFNSLDEVKNFKSSNVLSSSESEQKTSSTSSSSSTITSEAETQTTTTEEETSQSVEIEHFFLAEDKKTKISEIHSKDFFYVVFDSTSDVCDTIAYEIKYSSGLIICNGNIRLRTLDSNYCYATASGDYTLEISCLDSNGSFLFRSTKPFTIVPKS